MAGEFLRSHGIDLDSELSRIQFGTIPPEPSTNSHSKTIHSFINVSLPNKPTNTTWNVSILNGVVDRIEAHSVREATGGKVPVGTTSTSSRTIDGHRALLAPSLCHPHIHLDKAFLLSHPKYKHLQLSRGDFSEAMTLTSEAKSLFEEDDLLERGQRLIDESVRSGVTHMRAFVEVDAGVGRKCLDAGVELKRRAEMGKGRQRRCVIQLCAFAQLPLFSASKGDEDGAVIRGLMENVAGAAAVDGNGVGVVGSTPYVESDREKMERNVEWMVDLSIKHQLHVDFHLDYNLDAGCEPMVWHVVKTLRKKEWNTRNPGRTVVLGHCTRLTLFTSDEWHRLRTEIGDLPISFVGLPTSDLFMMRTPDRTMGTLNVPSLIQDFGLQACMGVNNIGNAFTPHGSCDPLTLACNGVGVYQAGTQKDAELLYECVSSRARTAIGLERQTDSDGHKKAVRAPHVAVEVGSKANLVLFGNDDPEWRIRKAVDEAVYLYDHCKGRRAFLDGVWTNEKT